MTRHDHIQVGIDAEAAWTELANIIPLLRVCLSPRSSRSEIRTPPKSRPPIDENVSKLLAEIDLEAGFYVHCLMDETNDYTPPLALDARVRSLAGRHGHFTVAEDRIATDFVSCAQTLVSKSYGFIAPPPAPSRMGPCQIEGCEGTRFPKGAGYVQCDTCQSLTDIETWRAEFRSRVQFGLMSRAELRWALKMLDVQVTPERLRKWISRKQLVPAYTEPERFRFSEAARLAKVELVA